MAQGTEWDWEKELHKVMGDGNVDWIHSMLDDVLGTEEKDAKNYTIRNNSNHYLITMLAPNLTKDKIKVHFEGNRLKVHLDYPTNTFSGNVQRDYSLVVVDADLEKVYPRLNNGVLTIEIRKNKNEKPFGAYTVK